MINPLISVLVPIFNSEKELRKCLDSIINQTYKNLEIILVNDGSTDKCGEICDEYAQKDSRIKVIHQENRGIASTRNVCLNNATGEYIAFVDSDDSILSDMCKDMLAKSLETDADMVVCDFENVYPEDMPKENTPIIPFEEGEILPVDYVRKVSGEHCGALSIVWNKLYKKHLFDNVKYPDGKIHEDDATIHRICHNCKKIFYIKKAYYLYHKNRDGIMHKKFSAKRLDSTDAILDRINFFTDNDYPDSMIYNSELFLINDFISSIRNLDKKSKKDRRAIKEKLQLIKPYCQKVLQNNATDKETKKTIRWLLFNPFIFFYI